MILLQMMEGGVAEGGERSSSFRMGAMEIRVPEYGMQVYEALSHEGFDAWFVGGYVRDALLGRAAHDVDIATDARWPQVKEACEAAGMSTYETGVKHGTLTVVPDGEHPVEVTTFRHDGSYSDSRHPDDVTFVDDIREDLARRDFTMNALAYQPAFGLFDPFDGQEDIHRGIIRVVGDPKVRFKEDALRILRACRFASQLGFALDPATYQAMYQQKSLLGNVSQERVTHELDELLLGAHVRDALLGCVDVLAYVLPELVAMKGCEQRTRYHCFDVLEHTAHAVQHAPQERIVRWAALCHDMGKPACAFFDDAGTEHFYGHAAVSAELAFGMTRRLLMSPAFAADLRALILLHSDVISPTRKSVRRALMRCSGRPELLRQLLDLKRADITAHAPAYAAEAPLMDEVESVLDSILENKDAFSVKMLAISGTDVMKAGIPEGPDIGRALDRLLEAVVEERLPNERGALLDALCTNDEREGSC